MTGIMDGSTWDEGIIRDIDYRDHNDPSIIIYNNSIGEVRLE